MTYQSEEYAIDQRIETCYFWTENWIQSHGGVLYDKYL